MKVSISSLFEKYFMYNFHFSIFVSGETKNEFWKHSELHEKFSE